MLIFDKNYYIKFVHDPFMGRESVATLKNYDINTVPRKATRGISP